LCSSHFSMANVSLGSRRCGSPQRSKEVEHQRRVGLGCPFRKPYPGRIRRNYGIGACSRAMVAILRLLIGALRNCIMSRGRLEAEVIVLRHQLNILRRQSPRRVRPNAFDRAIFVCLYRYFPDIGNAVACPIGPISMKFPVFSQGSGKFGQPRRVRCSLAAQGGAQHFRIDRRGALRPVAGCSTVLVSPSTPPLVAAWGNSRYCG